MLSPLSVAESQVRSKSRPARTKSIGSVPEVAMTPIAEAVALVVPLIRATSRFSPRPQRNRALDHTRNNLKTRTAGGGSSSVFM